MKYLSLCLPTNGIIEWVFPVLDEIYKQDVNEEEWEVVITDNGENQEFYEKMIEYESKHTNLIYKRTKAHMFQNQIEALKLATGEYLKFLNHRSLIEDGVIQWMINVVKDMIDEKPIIYMSNGALGDGERHIFSDFDGFVRGLKEYASWTTGVGVWRVDFESIPVDWVYNKISPHSDVLFREKNRGKYLIDDRVWAHDIDASHAQKGKYDLYKAFGCEEIAITFNLYIDGDITAETFKYIVKCYEDCVVNFYLKFNILKEPCSYLLDGFNDSMDIFIRKRRVLMRAYGRLPKIVFKKIYNKLRTNK